jgi:hypothetical protein
VIREFPRLQQFLVPRKPVDIGFRVRHGTWISILVPFSSRAACGVNDFCT